MKRSFFVAVRLFAAMVLIVFSVYARTETGAITETVGDPGAVIPGAKVTVKNVDTNAIRQVTVEA